MKHIILKTPEDTEAIAENIGCGLRAPMNIYLEGPLGAGKTTFVKGFLRGLGYMHAVKSPTYTLVETYALNEIVFLHADLYRIKDPIELENMGFRDYFNPNTISLIEWASHAKGWLPKPDILCTLSVLPHQGGRELTVERFKK